MSRRLIVTGVAAIAVAGTVVPSFAAFPITVHESTDNGVEVDTFQNGNPLVGARVTPDGQACVQVSLQLPVCTPGGIVQTRSAQRLPVVVQTYDGGAAVAVEPNGEPLVIGSVRDGNVCAQYQDGHPLCTNR